MEEFADAEEFEVGCGRVVCGGTLFDHKFCGL